jgi:hypothetical protein
MVYITDIVMPAIRLEEIFNPEQKNRKAFFSNGKKITLSQKLEFKPIV